MESKTPEIRFKGERGEWIEREIGSIFTEKKRSIELKDNTSYQLVTVKRRNGGVVPRVILKGRDILVKNYFQINVGDYLISKRQVVHGANGIVPDSLDGSVVSNEYLVALGNKNITTKFWTILSKRSEMHKMFFVSSYGVDIEKLVFDVNDWKNRTVIIPRLNEQNNITDLFQQLDTHISCHQRKHDKLLSLKKALLEKMFPKQGEDMPDVRFKGFSDKWEERKLGGVSDYKNGKGHEDKQKTFGKYELINLNSISINGGLKHSGKFVEVANATLNENDLVMVLSDVAHGDLLGRVALIPKNNKFVLNQRVALFRPSSDVVSLFLFYNINAHQTYFKSQGAGMSQLNISRSSVEEFASAFPQKSEQTKIGKLLQHLDTLLTHHQAQLKKLNNIKQACLEKMFV